MEFLGHIVGVFGIKPDSRKTEVILQYKFPGSPKEMVSFLGLIGYYRKFIYNFAERAHMLRKFAKEESLTTEQMVMAKQQFEDIKRVITAQPILGYPDFSATAGIFKLFTDASMHGFGAILSQDKQFNTVVIAFASKVTTEAESRWSQPELETAAIVWAVKKFEAYLKIH